MLRTFSVWAIGLQIVFGGAASAGAFGTVVPLGGAASDLALDEPRGCLYVANFTRNQIDVISLANNALQTSIKVASQPSALALSRDGRYLVAAHYGNYASPGSRGNLLTVIDLNSGGKQTFVLGNPPLGVAFGSAGRALVVTTEEFLLFDPASGAMQSLEAIQELAAKSLPQPPASFPPDIVAASVGVSGDGSMIYGLTDTIEFSYDVAANNLQILSYVSTPEQGPRVVSVNRDGSYYLAGWALNSRSGTLVAEFPSATGALNIGSHVFDPNRNLVYAQIPDSRRPDDPPMLQILDADNLAIRERLHLPENLAGKSVLSSDGLTMYSVSDSGVLVLPVGTLSQAPRVVANQEDVVFRGNYCDRRSNTQQIAIFNPGGGHTPFSLSSSSSGVTVSPTTGVTPATITLSVDPGAFQNQRGTATATITLSSAQAVNVPKPIRVLVNEREPDQRGTFVNVPGKLVDVLADPSRDRYYVLRQDTNQVLVFDAANNLAIATLRTGNVPTQMAITFDGRYLLIGSNDSQIIPVYDLETLQPQQAITMPFGHYPRSIAASANAILVASRVAGPVHTIDRVDMSSRTAGTLPSLGVFENKVNVDTHLAAAPNGSSIFVVSADGNVMLYDANADTFTISRKDAESLAGGYAASAYNQFAVGNRLLNASLVPVATFDTAAGVSSGFAFVDAMGLRTTAADSTAAGTIARFDSTGIGFRPTRMVEAPVLGDADCAFTRTIALLPSRNVIVNLTTSGFTVLPWNYDESVAPPKIDRVVNAADYSPSLAPGGLITIFGSHLSPVNIATNEMPLPSALGDSCLAVNGMPTPMLFVSPTQINAQLPFQLTGDVTLVLRTPGGISDNFNLTLLPGAPSVFRSGVAGPETNIATIVRDANNLLVTPSNPVHRGDTLVIYVTGLGPTNPPVSAGAPAPGDTPATVLTLPDVTLGGVGLPVLFAGLTPGQIGLYQINVSVPRNVPTGLSVPLMISQSGVATSIDIRVIE